MKKKFLVRGREERKYENKAEEMRKSLLLGFYPLLVASENDGCSEELASDMCLDYDPEELRICFEGLNFLTVAICSIL